MTDRLEMPPEQMINALNKQITRKNEIIQSLQNTLDHAQAENKRLTEKCDKQAMILRRLTPEKFSDTLFISGTLGEKDQNNMPEKLMVVPAYGVDFCYIYEYNGKTMGTEW